MAWFEKSIDFTGAIHLPGTMPPRAEEYTFLRKAGFEVAKYPDKPEVHWSLRLRHPEWGDANLIALRNPPRMNKIEIEYAVGLLPEERALVGSAGYSLGLTAKSHDKNILRDRKRCLRILRAVMGEDAAVGHDVGAWRFWSREALDDELVHDADLDVESLFCFHAVRPDAGNDETPPHWVHTHGLDSLGVEDFDILDPSGGFVDTLAESMRALAFAAVEGDLKSGVNRFQAVIGAKSIAAVDMATFRAKAPRDLLARIGLDEDTDHLDKRMVLCEPAGGILGRLFPKVRPARLFQTAEWDNVMLRFSESATDLMADRAQRTYPRFRALFNEFAELELPSLVKAGYATDDGDPDHREHLWFQVEGADEDLILAKLVNEPHAVSSLRQGQRVNVPIDKLSDWIIMSPAGNTTPRWGLPARMIRAKWDLVVEALRQHRAAGAGQ